LKKQRIGHGQLSKEASIIMTAVEEEHVKHHINTALVMSMINERASVSLDDMNIVHHKYTNQVVPWNFTSSYTNFGVDMSADGTNPTSTILCGTDVNKRRLLKALAKEDKVKLLTGQISTRTMEDREDEQEDEESESKEKEQEDEVVQSGSVDSDEESITSESSEEIIVKKKKSKKQKNQKEKTAPKPKAKSVQRGKMATKRSVSKPKNKSKKDSKKRKRSSEHKSVKKPAKKARSK
jgi:hypothetical protein